MKDEDIEIHLLLEAIYLKYGYDFRNEAKASVKRRIHQRLLLSRLADISVMQYKILYDKSFFETFFWTFPSM